ncbi:hypothetical protein DL98DRAFT_611100 [Cadophora sp. DSE1049]|nr:hypothetical protein DL98DRAFT_611100 [Cadophora sp. DSE1049]
MEDTVAEPSKVTNEPYDIVDSPLKPGTKFFLVECGHYDSSKNRLGGNPDMYQLNGLHAGHADAINAAVENLTEIMREADWRGDYTVWISPLSGPDKQERVRFIYGQIQNYESALSELQQLPLWQDGYCTMVYMTSKNGKLRWFVKMTPFASRHFCDEPGGWTLTQTPRQQCRLNLQPSQQSASNREVASDAAPLIVYNIVEYTCDPEKSKNRERLQTFSSRTSDNNHVDFLYVLQCECSHDLGEGIKKGKDWEGGLCWWAMLNDGFTKRVNVEQVEVFVDEGGDAEDGEHGGKCEYVSDGKGGYVEEENDMDPPTTARQISARAYTFLRGIGSELVGFRVVLLTSESQTHHLYKSLPKNITFENQNIINKHILSYHQGRALFEFNMDKRDGSAASNDSSASKPNKRLKLLSPSPPSANDTSTSKSRSTSTVPSSTIAVEPPKKAKANAPSKPTRKKRDKLSKERSSISSPSTPKLKKGAASSNATTPLINGTTPFPRPSNRGLDFSDPSPISPMPTIRSPGNGKRSTQPDL